MSGGEVRRAEYITFHRAIYFLAPRPVWWQSPAPTDGTWESRWWISAPLTPAAVAAVAASRGATCVLADDIRPILALGRLVADWGTGYLLQLDDDRPCLSGATAGNDARRRSGLAAAARWSAARDCRHRRLPAHEDGPSRPRSGMARPVVDPRSRRADAGDVVAQRCRRRSPRPATGPRGARRPVVVDPAASDSGAVRRGVAGRRREQRARTAAGLAVGRRCRPFALAPDWRARRLCRDDCDGPAAPGLGQLGQLGQQRCASCSSRAD